MQPNTGRRLLLLGGAAGVGLAGSSFLFLAPLLQPALEFSALGMPNGFRKLSGGKNSLSFDPFFGIARDDDPALTQALQQVRTEICGNLFEQYHGDAGVVPIASFSDYYCPYCRLLTKRLSRLEENASGTIRITWHELPLLGNPSKLAARAALAARRQDAYARFHKRMMRAAFQATPGYIAALSGEIGINHDRLLQDMNSPEIRNELLVSAALARIFGLIGTPALVVGRTVVVGEVDQGVLTCLIDRERQDGPIAACAT